MSVIKAAIEVLRDATAPLHYTELTREIIKKKLWIPQGKTPEATVNARISVDIKQKGDESALKRVGPGIFCLRDSSAGAQQASLEPVKHRSAKIYSFTDSAEQILQQSKDKQPMHYRHITDMALERNWLNTEGKTPEATMYAQILSEIKRHQRAGKQPRFVQHGNGLVGLSAWMGFGLSYDIEQHNKKIRKELHKKLYSMDPSHFEELIGRLLAEIGFEDIEVTKRCNDGGIDVRGTLVVGDVIKTSMAVQVKRWKHNVQAPVVQQVRGSLGTHEHGLIISTSDYSEGAKCEAVRNNAVPVGLMNGEQLVSLLIEYGIFVKKQTRDIIDLEA